MDRYDTDKKYEPFKIPDRQQVLGDVADGSFSSATPVAPVSKKEALFYEIEYDNRPVPGVGRFVLKPQPIKPPEKDEIRDRFHQMRELAWAHRTTLDNSRFFSRRVHHNNAVLFYKQGMFMKDFTDDYAESTPFSSYYPNYQMMGYEQLRTYFTWRTAVRQGYVADTSLSYAFLYMYELLNNIGVEDPQDGFDRLLSFWKAFSVFDPTIDKYVLKWLKDYHIYYGLAQPFKAFVDENDLARHYPRMADPDDNFDLYCSISKYDIRKSAFFTDDNVPLITDCFYFTIQKLRQVFLDNGIHMDNAIFHPTRGMSVWTPFGNALFHPWMMLPDKRIVLAENEIYLCHGNQWAFSTVLTTTSGRQLIGYVMKQMESELRKITKFKYKLSANIDAVAHEIVGSLQDRGLSLEKIVRYAVVAFYREATKTVIRVEHGSLSRIRREALATQEKLIVPEGESPVVPAATPVSPSLASVQSAPPASTGWANYRAALTPTEIDALSVLWHGQTDIKQYADGCGIMLEVLVDGINEKAMDFIGDNLMDEEFVLYDDYKEQIKEWVG